MGNTPVGKKYYDGRWRTAVEQHVPYLRNHPQTSPVDTGKLKGYRTRYDLFAFLTQERIPERYHWIIMRVNGFSSPEDFDESIGAVLVPSTSVIEELFSKVMK